MKYKTVQFDSCHVNTIFGGNNTENYRREVLKCYRAGKIFEESERRALYSDIMQFAETNGYKRKNIRRVSRAHVVRAIKFLNSLLPSSRQFQLTDFSFILKGR